MKRFLALVVTIFAILFSCGSIGIVSVSASTSGATGVTWLLTQSALQSMATSSTALATLDKGRVIELVPLGSSPFRPSGVSVTPAFTVDSVVTLRSLIQNNAVPSWAHAVLFDDEAWSLTPLSEQLYPAKAAAWAEQLAGSRRLSLWCAPAIDLVSVLDPSASSYWQGYLNLNLAGQMGRSCNGLDIQAQSLERNAATYRKLVDQASQQARAARSGIALTAGLSTNPPGPTVTLSELEADVTATITTAHGYWLNIPSPGPWCPTCAPADPALGIKLLNWL